MKTLPPAVSDAERAVSHFKREKLAIVMRHIIQLAKRQTYVSAGDIPESIVAPEHRQGVASNAWNALKALEILVQLPLQMTIPEQGIYGGRRMNANAGAKGRWVCVYTMADEAKANAWLRANGALEILPTERLAQSLMSF